MLRKSSPHSYKKIGPEQGFKLPLPTVVEGQDAFGKAFKEETVLSYISQQGASFCLKNSIAIGSKLKLIIDLPPKLAEDKDLKLAVHGKVVFVEVSDDHDCLQRISMRFDSNRYIIKPDR
jgi:hypothetical protein